MAPSTNSNFPSLESINNQVRAICNDSFAGASSTPGEGQILTDFVPNANGSGFTTTNNPFLLNHVNSAIRELYRKIRITGDGLLIQDNYLWEGLEAVDGPLGSGVADPTVQCYIDTEGWHYGGANVDDSFLLPSDMYLPIRLWERASDTTDSFQDIRQVTNGLPGRFQVSELNEWEYRNGALYFVGATTVRDVRLRYTSLFPQFFNADMDFSTTYVPVIDCQDFVAYKAAEKVSLSLGNPQITAMLTMEADKQLFDLKNERVRRMQQNNDYRRQGFNDQNLANMLDLYGI